MASWSQSKPPATATCNPVNRFKGKQFRVDDAFLDKQRKTSTGRMIPSTSDRLTLSPMNIQQEIGVASSETAEFEYEVMYSKEKVNALLRDKFTGRMYDSKAKQEWMTEYMKKLKVCIKWFQKGLEDLVEEKDNLRKMLDLSERKSVESEAAMKFKEDELNAAISEMETNVSSLKASLANEVSEKLREKEARMALEKSEESLQEKLKRSEQNALTTNEKVKTQADMYKRLQEYITSLQQYNAKLQTELTAATGAKKQVEKEKVVILENLSTLRVHHNLLHKRLNSAEISRDS